MTPRGTGLLARWGSASDLMLDARGAAIRIGILRDEVESIEQGGAHGQGVSAGPSDPTARRAIALARISEEKRAEAEALYEVIDRACDVLYGSDGMSGVASLVDCAHADVLWHRYCGAETWAEVSARCHASVSTCRRMHDTAMNTIDAIGLADSAMGVGHAEA